MRFIRWSVLVAVLLAISVYVSPADADSIGPSCGSCFGGIWTLEYAPAGGTTYDIFYKVNTSGMSTATFGPISEVAFKVSSSLVSVSVLIAPAGWGTTVVPNVGLSNSCSGGGGGFACSTGAATLPIGSATYQWEFLVDIGAAALLTGGIGAGGTCAADNCASIKANGTVTGNILSERITLQPVPEPTTLLLVGSALVGVGMWGRKRWSERRPA